MKSDAKLNIEINQKIEKVEKEIQPALYEQSMDKSVVHDEDINMLNSKILKTTMMIKDQYPELYKYLEEMPETIPDEKNPDITLQNLKTYSESLTSMLSKYILEHPVK